MASVDELLALAEETPEDGMTKELTIDPISRRITLPSNNAIAVYHDKVLSKARFTMTGSIVTTLASANVFINYISPGETNASQYAVTDKNVSGTTMTFTWKLDRIATKRAGGIRFIVCFILPNGDEWNTTVANGQILEGIEPGELTPEEEEAANSVFQQLVANLRSYADSLEQELGNSIEQSELTTALNNIYG